MVLWKFSHFKLYGFSSVPVLIRSSRAGAFISLPSVRLRAGYGSMNTKISSTSTTLNFCIEKLKYQYYKCILKLNVARYEKKCLLEFDGWISWMLRQPDGWCSSCCWSPFPWSLHLRVRWSDLGRFGRRTKILLISISISWVLNSCSTSEKKDHNFI